MNNPFELPVLLTCPKCLFIFRAPGVGIVIKPLKSSEQPDTSPEFRATGRSTSLEIMNKHKKGSHFERERKKMYQTESLPSFLVGMDANIDCIVGCFFGCGADLST